MGKEILTFVDVDVDFENVLLSNKIFSSEKNFKYFIG